MFVDKYAALSKAGQIL